MNSNRIFKQAAGSFGLAYLAGIGIGELDLHGMADLAIQVVFWVVLSAFAILFIRGMRLMNHGF